MVLVLEAPPKTHLKVGFFLNIGLPPPSVKAQAMPYMIFNVLKNYFIL